MREILLVNNELYTEDFVKRCVIKKIKLQLLQNLSSPKTAYITEYIKKTPDTFSNLTGVDGKTIIIQAANNIVYEKVSTQTQKGFRIFINKKINFKSTNIKLITLVDLMNDGNLELEPFPVFSNTFQSIEKNITSLYNFYRLTGGAMYEYLPI